jgi:ATP-dependent Zn protease
MTSGSNCLHLNRPETDDARSIGQHIRPLLQSCNTADETARVIDAEVLRIISESHEEAKSLLSAHPKELNALVEALLSRETLNEQEILQVTGLPPAPALETVPLAVVDVDRRVAVSR